MTNSNTIKMEKYLPKTICHCVNGFVCNISKVPPLNSSESVRMVMAGTRNNNIHGAKSKNLSREAYPKSKILSFKKKRNSPFTNRNSTIAIYPVRLLKNCCSSFLQMLHMRYKLLQFNAKQLIVLI